MHRIRVSAVLVAMAAGTAAAEKPRPPTPEQAKQAADAWLAVAQLGGDPGVSRDEGKALIAVSRMPLFMVALDPERGCKPADAKSLFTVQASLSCLRRAAQTGELAPWTKDDAKRLRGPLRRYSGKLAMLERGGATLVHHHEDCATQGSDLVLAVVLDKDTPKVAAVFSQLYFCDGY